MDGVPFGVCLMFAIGGLLWTLLGFAMQDVFIWFPNLIGLLLGSFQVGDARKSLSCLFLTQFSRNIVFTR